MVQECPNKAISIEDFQVKINKPEPGEEVKGKIVSCMNCGLLC
jgi:energy-converting hydrogenase B subunit K